jgi:type III secretion protein V
VREATRQLPPALLADVLRRLLAEGVSIRPLRTILEALLEAGGAARGAPALAEAARRALRRHLGHRHAGEGPLPALLLDPATEEALRAALVGDVLALAPPACAALLAAVDAEARRCAETRPVLLVSGDVRRPLRALLGAGPPRLAVLAFEDVPPDLPVRPVGRVGLGPPVDSGPAPLPSGEDGPDARRALRSA